VVRGLLTEPRTARVLVVDDEPDVVGFEALLVLQAGLVPVPVCDAKEVLAVMEREHPDIVLLDIVLGEIDGFELLTELRRRYDVPVILVSAKASEEDKVRGLELGAQDYIVKPFSSLELIARVRAHLRSRRESTGAHAVLQAGPLAMDVDGHVVTKNGREVALTATEFRLLQHLLARAGTVVPTSVLAKEIWGYDDASTREVVRVTLHRLRRKVEDDPSHPQLVQTVAGVGVKLMLASHRA